MKLLHVCYMLAVVFATVCVSQSYRILGLFPHPGMSHFHFFHPLVRELALRGHEVVVVSHYPDKDPPSNYTDYKIGGMEQMVNFMNLEWFEHRYSFHQFLEFFMLYDWGMESCRTALYSEAIKKVLESKERFDLILTEHFNTDCMMGVAYLLKAPVIGLSSCALLPWHFKRVGNPFVPSYTPLIFLQKSERMDFLGRVWNTVNYAALNALYIIFTQRSTNKLLRERFDSSLPDIDELTKQTSLILINEHHSLSGIQPLSPAVIELGGLHIKDPKPLDKDLKHILDNAPKGIIYVNWGSMVRASTLPPYKRDIILKVFAQFEETVLLKWENDTIPNKPPNLKILKWLPQRDILSHPNVKVFWGHGGLLGASEAAYCGVPMVVTPFFGDQFHNSAKLENRGMGVILQYSDFTEEKIKSAIQRALSEEAKRNAQRVSYSYKNRPARPIDTAVWWVEHVIKSGGSPLTFSYSSNLPWYSFHSLDVYAFLLFCLVISVFVVKKLVKWYFSTRSNQSKLKTQ